jgi:putative transposase
MARKMSRSGSPPVGIRPPSGDPEPERGRFSSRRKMESVLRLLRGEELDALSRELGVGAATLTSWARHRDKGVRTSKQRVLRLLREANLLAPSRARRVLGSRVHDGSITPEQPNVMWGIDAISVITRREGMVTVFAAIEHASAECVGIDAAKYASRFEALEPIRQGVRTHFGGFGEGIVHGLKLRHDNGSQFVSNHFQDEIAFLGLESSPSFVRSPEGNGCIERFFRTLKEQLLWVRSFEDADEVQLAVAARAALYNEQWLIERHGHRSPAAFRRERLAIKASA